MIPDCPRWSQMILDDPRQEDLWWSRTQTIPDEPRWSQMIPDDPRWSQMLPDDPRQDGQGPRNGFQQLCWNPFLGLLKLETGTVKSCAGQCQNNLNTLTKYLGTDASICSDIRSKVFPSWNKDNTFLIQVLLFERHWSYYFPNARLILGQRLLRFSFQYVSSRFSKSRFPNSNR